MTDIEQLLELNDLHNKVVIGLQRQFLHTNLGASLRENLIHLPRSLF